jgi:hypothetical protein
MAAWLRITGGISETENTTHSVDDLLIRNMEAFVERDGPRSGAQP